MSRARGRELLRLHADAADQEILPLLGGKGLPALIERRQHFALGQLDLAQRINAERAAILLLGDGRVVGEFDLGIEAAREHAFVGVDHRLADAHVLQLQARQGGQKRIGAGIQSGGDDVDQLDVPLFLGAGLEQLMLAGADGLLAELALDDLEAFGDFLFIHRGAVAAQQKLGDVGGNGVLPLEFAHQILAHHIAFKGLGGNRIDGVQLLAHKLIVPVWWAGNESPARKHPAKRSRPFCRCRHRFPGRPSPCRRAWFRAPACPSAVKCSDRIGWCGHPRARLHNRRPPTRGISPRSTLASSSRAEPPVGLRGLHAKHGGHHFLERHAAMGILHAGAEASQHRAGWPS